MKIVCIVGDLTDGLENKFLQYIRDFDVAHPGCEFRIMVLDSTKTVDEMKQALEISPNLTFISTIKN